MYTEIVSKPLYRVLAELTQEPRLEIALPLAVKELVRLKLKDASEQRRSFEEQYGMNFESFKAAWEADQIECKHSYEVERDYWEWEASVSDEMRLQQMMDSLL